MATPLYKATSSPTVLSSTCDLLQADQSGFTILASCTGSIPTTANVFQHGCIMYKTDSGTGINAVYQNTGSIASPAWTVFDTGTGFSLPAAITDATTTTGTSFGITFSTLTSGVGQKLNGPGAGLLAAGILSDIEMGAATTGYGQLINTSGVYTGLNGIWQLNAPAATTGTIGRINGTGLTSGNGLYIVGGTSMSAGGNLLNLDLGAGTAGTGTLIQTTGVYTDTTGLFRLVANAATTGALSVISGTGLTTGVLQHLIAGTSVGASGVGQFIDMGAATNGTAQKITTTGVYTGNGLRFLQAGNATTAVLDLISGSALTSGIAHKVIAGAASLTSGRYYSANDGALEVFGVGANGHLVSGQTTPPTIVVTQQNGISAASITASSTDTCGSITTTGTNNNSGTTILTVTFNKTYTTAPKSIMITPANASAAGPNPAYVTITNATTWVLTIPASASAGATPSWFYQVIA